MKKLSVFSSFTTPELTTSKKVDYNNMLLRAFEQLIDEISGCGMDSEFNSWIKGYV